MFNLGRTVEHAGGTSISDNASGFSNITILRPSDMSILSRRSWAREVIMMDNGNFWNTRAEFVFATLLYCLNIGNLWRFPTQVIQYGEGAFIYLHLFFTVLFGTPMLFFELAIGQYTNKGFMHVFDIVPFLEGLSYAMAFFSNTIVHVYNTILIFNFVYLFSFIRTDAPLSDRKDYGEMCFHENRSNTFENLHFLNEVVMVSDDASCTFNVRNLCIAFVIWLMIWVYIAKDYAVNQNVLIGIYIAVISALIVTLIATITLEEARSGLLRLLLPSSKNFVRYEVYLHAFVESIITLGLGMGPLINYGCHSNFRTPIHIHAVLIIVSTLVASIIMAMIVFGAVGVYSAERGFSDAVLSGQEYYVHVLLSKLFRKMTFGLKNFIIFVFYGAFFTTGFYCSITYAKLMVGFIRSKWKVNPIYHSEVLFLFCAFQFLISGGMITYHGIHILYWSAQNIFTTFSVLTLVALETTSFAFFYGMCDFCEDVEFMVGYYPNWWFKTVWYCSAGINLLVMIASGYEFYLTGIDWYGIFCIFMYIMVVILPLTIHAIYVSVIAIRKGHISRVFHPQAVQSAFPTNWE